jgi:hypothetical protein
MTNRRNNLPPVLFEVDTTGVTVFEFERDARCFSRSDGEEETVRFSY